MVLDNISVQGKSVNQSNYDNENFMKKRSETYFYRVFSPKS